MIRLSFFLVVAAVCAAFVSAPSKPEFRPPGTVEFTEGLFFDETEISVFNWKEYQMWLEKEHGKSSQEYLASQPDTSLFDHFYAPFAQHYFTHPAYRNYPMVCITYEQAVAFCAWRTDRVRELVLVRKVDRNLEEIPCITYRLPSKEEWELAAASPLNKKSLKKLPKVYQEMDAPYNLKGQYDQSAAGGTFDFTSPVDVGARNSFGMQNLFGNVAEMVNQKGIAKGGSWDHTLEESALTNDLTYSEGTEWLGFRCVCEVKML